MPPQPGMFALPYASTHKARADVLQPDSMNMAISYQTHSQSQASMQTQGIHYQHHPPAAGSSSRAHGDDGKRDKKRKDISGKLGKEMHERRDEGRHLTESISALHSTAIQLASRPETHPLYNLRLYPISLERSAILAQLSSEGKHSLEMVQTAYEEEREKVEEEWRKGRDRIRERLLEGIEERRRRAREEKEGEGTVNDPSLDSQTRSHITRKLRNKVAASPPLTPLGLPGATLANGLGSSTPITAGPFLNPHSLAVDELPSPFPFPLTSVTLTNGSHTATGGGGGGGSSSRRRAKGTGHSSIVGVGGLGKSLGMLVGSKESEIEADLNEIRRVNKRRRAAAVSSTKFS
ncbi:hypothetical protein BV22DRAFT_1091218 [Leucogyrophana mollusca]|uniref:Uncharacterized protein n=1 Tax=Leucogyrophana mollusca TaxID=85980 RepID=A0ACB8BFQ9_9AGAM|nr:hypothetical protein BV22DRAFT_1091218 [Leucogyrophana mollusca]